MQPGVFSRAWMNTPVILMAWCWDLGVSSMQLDMAERGFFLHEGGAAGHAHVAGTGPAPPIWSIPPRRQTWRTFSIFMERSAPAAGSPAPSCGRGTRGPIETTLRLAEIVESCLPRSKPGQSHPATRSFQALRIAVNDEFGELFRGLTAAERALRPGGKLAVVTFHSIEDRMVKRFLQARAGQTGRGSRHAPEMTIPDPQFILRPRKAIAPDAEELAENPRARSARLRVAVRTEAPAGTVDPREIGMPQPKQTSRRKGR